MAKLLRLTLSVQVFDCLVADAANENIPSVELARRVLASYYSQKTGSTGPTASAAVAASPTAEPAVGGASGGGLRSKHPVESRPLITPQKKERILARAVDAYGRIQEDLDWIFTSPSGRKQIAKIGRDLMILGGGISLLRESLDQLEELQQICNLSEAPEAAAGQK